jgi:hypothetical protein
MVSQSMGEPSPEALAPERAGGEANRLRVHQDADAKDAHTRDHVAAAKSMRSASASGSSSSIAPSALRRARRNPVPVAVPRIPRRVDVWRRVLETVEIELIVSGRGRAARSRT